MENIIDFIHVMLLERNSLWCSSIVVDTIVSKSLYFCLDQDNDKLNVEAVNVEKYVNVEGKRGRGRLRNIRSGVIESDMKTTEVYVKRMQTNEVNGRRGQGWPFRNRRERRRGERGRSISR